MKHKDEQIHTIPDGVWEAGQTDESLNANHHISPAIDAQGNGYPPMDNKSVGQLEESGHPKTKKECGKIH